MAARDWVLPTDIYLERTKFDRHSRCVSTIDAVHRMIHEGFAYHASGKATAIADGATLEMLFKVPAGTFPHFHKVRMQYGAGDVEMDAYEGTTVSADGTSITAYNLNRNSSNTPNMTAFHTPTITADGTKIHAQWAPPTASGTGGSQEGVVDVTQGEEWILKPDTNYLFRITNNSGEIISIGYEIMWYEIDFEPIGYSGT